MLRCIFLLNTFIFCIFYSVCINWIYFCNFSLRNSIDQIAWSNTDGINCSFKAPAYFIRSAKIVSQWRIDMRRKLHHFACKEPFAYRTRLQTLVEIFRQSCVVWLVSSLLQKYTQIAMLIFCFNWPASTRAGRYGWKTYRDISISVNIDNYCLDVLL